MSRARAEIRRLAKEAGKLGKKPGARVPYQAKSGKAAARRDGRQPDTRGQ